MRRILIFVAVLALGLAILFYVDRRGRRADEEARGTQPPVGGPEQADPAPRLDPIPPPIQGTKSGSGPRVGISGEIGFTRPDPETGLKVLDFFAGDVNQVGDSTEFDYTLTEIVVEQFVPEDGEKLRRIEAVQGRAKIEVDGSMNPTLQDDGHVRMTDVVIDQLRGVEYAPVRMTAPAIDAYLDMDRFVTPGYEPVLITGKGLSAEGRGLDYDGKIPRFEMRGGGWAEITGRDGRVARVESEKGPLLVAPKPGGAPGELRLSASGGAHLSATGAPLLDLVADEIEVFVFQDAAGDFHLQEAICRGNVVASRGLDVFRGEQGDALFDELGALVSLEVKGEPQVRMTLADDEGRPLEVEARGAGPVKLLVEGEGGSFNFLGPGELDAVAREMRIRFQDHLSGTATEDRSQGHFEAVGEAAFEQGTSNLRSESLVADLYAGEPEAADVTTAGPTLAKALDQDEMPVDFEASGGMELEVRGKVWTVPDARGVSMQGGGPEAFQASAGRVQDFQWLARSFRASETISYVSTFGTAKGQTLESREDGVRHLEGTEEEPASLLLFPSATKDNTLRGGSFRARVIDVHPEWAEARGAGHLLLAQGQRVLEADADFLRFEAPAEDSDGKRRFEISADEVENVELREPGQSVTLKGAVFKAKGVRYGEDGERGPKGDLWLERAWLAGEVIVEGRGAIELDVDADEFELITYAVGKEAGVAPDKGALEFRWSSQGIRRLHVQEGARDVTLTAELAEVVGRVSDLDAEKPSWSVVSAVAQGNVHAISHGEHELDGYGERFELFQDRRIVMVPKVGSLVTAKGRLPGSEVQYDVRAERLESTLDKLVALGVSAEVEIPLLPVSVPGIESLDDNLPQIPGRMQSAYVKAARLEATRLDSSSQLMRLDFLGGMEARGSDESGVPVSLKATQFTVLGDFSAPKDSNDRIQRVEAKGPFTAVYGGLGRVSGSGFAVSQSRLELEGDPAELQSEDMVMESSRMVLDLETFLVESGRGVLRGTDPSRPWSLEFATLEPRTIGEDTLMVMASPVYAELERTARAVWATGWMKTEAWRARGHQLLFGEPLPLEFQQENANAERPPAPAQADLVQEAFTRLYAGTLSKYLRAALLEGEVEATVLGRRVARADAIYMNVDGGRGWLRGVELIYDLAVSGRAQRLRTRAEEFISQPDGSLVAQNATLTTCTHDVPHFTVRTGELSLVPREDGRWRFSAVGNRVIFRRGIQLPLPPIRNVVLDKSGDFEGFENDSGEVTTIDNIVVQNTPRFGTAIGTKLAFDIGNLGKRIAKFLSFDNERTSGKWRTDGSWLSSRGPLLGIGLELRERNADTDKKEDYWLNAWVRGIPDEGEDRGLVRVDPDDRDTLRNWFNLRGRYPFDDRQWIDVVVNTQNDPGVQAEFFQGEFQSFEEDQSYVHWRKARDGAYFNANALWRVDDFRSEIEELPSAGAFIGRNKVGSLGGIPLLHTGSLDVANLRRRPGDPDFETVFTDNFGNPDGGDNISVLRADSVQRLELAFEDGGVNAIPFLEARATAWDEGVGQEDQPNRLALHGGLELSTTLLKSGRAGYHTLAPVARYRYELSYEENDGLPYRFDNVEDPIDGDTVEVGLRSIWRRPAAGDSLDIEVTGSRRMDRAGGQPDRERVNVLGGFRTEIGGVPVAVLHDGRYDPDNDKTTYSNSTFALRPFDPLILEVGYQRGLDDNFANLYELARLQASYRISEKWEITALNWVSISNSDSLRNQFVLRRMAHDFVLEMGITHFAGEGGTGITFNFSPLLTFRRPRVGLLDR